MSGFILGAPYFFGIDFRAFKPQDPQDPIFVTCAWMIMCTQEFGRVHMLGDYICFSNGFCRGEFAFASDALKEFCSEAEQKSPPEA